MPSERDFRRRKKNVNKNTLMGLIQSALLVYLLLFEIAVGKSAADVYSPTNNDQLVRRLDSAVWKNSLENSYFITQLLIPSGHIFDPSVLLVV